MLHSNLNHYINEYPNTPLGNRLHILLDVSKGLNYLHSQSPPLVHRDLSAWNIMLTKGLTAKITDLGSVGIQNGNYSDDDDNELVMTGCPGIRTIPPECALHGSSKNSYTTKSDVFIFGLLIIHTLNGRLPGIKDFMWLKEDPKFKQYWIEGKIQLIMRDEAVHEQIGSSHCLYPLLVLCLHDRPEERPASDEVEHMLKHLCTTNPRQVSSKLPYFIKQL